MPLCGLRGWPLNTRRSPNDPERGPRTGGSSRRLSGAASLNVASAARMRGCSRATRASSSGARFTWRGATLSDCVA